MCRHIPAGFIAIVVAIAMPGPPVAAAQDLRSPDARDAGESVVPSQDHRTPDARDAADGRGTSTAPEVTIVRVPAAAPAPAPTGGLDWFDAGLGAATVLAFIALGFAGVALLSARRPHPSRRFRNAG